MAKDARGHGSEKRGVVGAHAEAADQVGQKSISDRVLDVVRNSPLGFTVSPNGDVPTRGYMVSVPGRTRIVSPEDMKGSGHTIVSDYARTNAALLREKGAHIGAWQDTGTGKVHLDVSHNIPRQRDAVAAGKTRNQIAIWDVKRKREIQTGGSGDRH